MSIERVTRRRCRDMTRSESPPSNAGAPLRRPTSLDGLPVRCWGLIDELVDGMSGSVGAAMGAAIGPYRESRLNAERNQT